MAGELEALVRACAVDELAPGEGLQIPLDPPIAVFNVDGLFYATDDWCTHDNSSLTEEGYVEGDRVECGWHGAIFCIKTGAVENPPARRPLRCYPVRINDGEVFVIVSDDA